MPNTAQPTSRGPDQPAGPDPAPHVSLPRGDIQGNVLEGYSYGHAAHRFYRLSPGAAHQALAELFEGDHFRVTNASASPRLQGIDPTLNVAFTSAGLECLGVSPTELKEFAEEFREGMEARSADLLDDPKSFAPMWRGRQVHMWLSVYGTEEAKVGRRIDELDRVLAPGAQPVGPIVTGQAIQADGHLFEHFGFRDGISNPSIVGARTRPGGGKPVGSEGWEPLEAGEFLLGHRDEAGEVAGGAPARLGANGTFVVFRVLKQDVAGFRAHVAERAERLGVTYDYLAARIVGRERDGRPLVDHREGHVNDFRYREDPDGSRCPLGSHVRRANLRDHGFPSLVSRHRIIRRGMPYGPPLPEDADDSNDSEDPRGLLFICMQASIERQFEFIQSRWLNDGAAVGQGSDRDPLVAPAHGDSRFIIQGDRLTARAPKVCAGLQSFVTCLGGDYFFMPGIEALRRLSRGAAGGES